MQALGNPDLFSGTVGTYPISSLKEQFDKGGCVNFLLHLNILGLLPNLDHVDDSTVSELVRTYLSELSGPILTTKLFSDFIKQTYATGTISRLFL